MNDDLISRSALLEALKPLRTQALVLQCIAAAPAIDAAPVVHGQWDGESDGYAKTDDGEMAPVIDVWYCSKCGYCIDEGIDDETVLPDYCPSCGAMMDKPLPF